MMDEKTKETSVSNDSGKLLNCSFCGRSRREVVVLVAGPGVYICDQCTDLATDIVREKRERMSVEGASKA